MQPRTRLSASAAVAAGAALIVTTVVMVATQPPAVAATASRRAIPVSRVPSARALDPEARAVVRLFVLTAVARKHLRLAYYLAGPQIRQDLTLGEWETGMIPVIPYPLDPRRMSEPRVDFAHPAEVQLQLLLWSQARPGDSQYFVIGLIKTPRGWLVNGWAPAAASAVPAG
jgi:hypothetical protein